MITGYERQFYADVNQIRREIKAQNEILTRLVETLNELLVNKIENED